jgi:hypothetical protein
VNEPVASPRPGRRSVQRLILVCRRISTRPRQLLPAGIHDQGVLGRIVTPGDAVSAQRATPLLDAELIDVRVERDGDGGAVDLVCIPLRRLDQACHLAELDVVRKRLGIQGFLHAFELRLQRILFLQIRRPAGTQRVRPHRVAEIFRFEDDAGVDQRRAAQSANRRARSRRDACAGRRGDVGRPKWPIDVSSCPERRAPKREVGYWPGRISQPRSRTQTVKGSSPRSRRARADFAIQRATTAPP